jgi:hypothetical protein
MNAQSAALFKGAHYLVLQLDLSELTNILDHVFQATENQTTISVELTRRSSVIRCGYCRRPANNSVRSGR